MVNQHLNTKTNLLYALRQRGWMIPLESKICTSRQTQTETLAFCKLEINCCPMSCPWKAADTPTRATTFCLACHAHGKQQTSPLEQPIFVQLVRLSTNPIQTANSYRNGAGFKGGRTGASVAPGKQHYSRVRADGANVVRDCLTKKTKKCIISELTHSPHHGASVWQKSLLRASVRPNVLGLELKS